jgi:hypothetical protein
MQCNIYKTVAPNLHLVHLERATQWGQLWFKQLISTDTKRDYRLENIHKLGGLTNDFCIAANSDKRYLL